MDAFGSKIWGSMGDGVAVTGNVIDGCNDVCLDAEGTFNFTASGNYVADGPNGALATFYQGRNIVFSGNTVVTHTYTYPLVEVAGVETSPVQNEGISFIANTFLNMDTSGIAAATTSSSSTKTLVWRANTFRNVDLAMNYDVLGAEVSDNNFTYDWASGTQFNAIFIYRLNQCLTCQTVPPLQAVVKNNTVVSNAAQPSGSAAITVVLGDGIHDGYGVTSITGNHCGGSNPFPVDINVGTGYTNSVLPTLFNIQGNELCGPSITKSFTRYISQPPVIQTGNIDMTTGQMYAGDSTPLGPDIYLASPGDALLNETAADTNFSGCATSCAWQANYGGGGGWSLANGSASYNSASGTGSLAQPMAYMAVPLVSGAWYKIAVTYTTVTGTPALFAHGGINAWNSGNGTMIPIAANSTQYLIVQANGGGGAPYLDLFATVATGGTSGSFTVTGISVKPLGGAIGAQGPITSLTSVGTVPNGVNPSYVSFNGNITAPVVPTNIVEHTGPPAATGFQYGLQDSASAPAAHSVPVYPTPDGTTHQSLVSYRVIPDCPDTGGKHLNYSQATDTWICGTGGGGSGGTIATDNFATSSVYLSSYPNWTTTEGSFYVSSPNHLQPSGAAQDLAFWNANSFPNNQWAQATIVALGTEFIGVAVRVSTGSHGYDCVAGPSSVAIRLHNGVGTDTTLWTGAAFTPGDVMYCSASGTTITLTETGASPQTHGVTDATLASGSAGLGGYSSDVATLLSNFSGGSL
jgi:hypothetical protein